MSEVDLDLLKEAGLTEYEAKSYVGLLRYGSMEGREVAEKTDVPKTRVYDALRSITKKGLASKIQERPMKFKPVEPENGLKPLYERKKNKIEHYEYQAISSLNQIEQIGERKEIEQKVDVIHGHQNMFSQMTERFQDAKDEVFGLVVGRVPPRGERIKLRKLIERGVDFRIATAEYNSENREAYDEFNEYADVRYYEEEDLEYVIVVKDRETAIINVLDPDEEKDRITIFFEVPQLAEAMAEYLESVWKDSTPLEDVEPSDN